MLRAIFYLGLYVFSAELVGAFSPSFFRSNSPASFLPRQLELRASSYQVWTDLCWIWIVSFVTSHYHALCQSNPKTFLEIHKNFTLFFSRDDEYPESICFRLWATVLCYYFCPQVCSKRSQYSSYRNANQKIMMNKDMSPAEQAEYEALLEQVGCCKVFSSVKSWHLLVLAFFGHKYCKYRCSHLTGFPHDPAYLILK